MADSTKEQRQLAIEAYKVLVSVMTHEETLVWRRNEFLFAANGGLMTILGLVFNSIDAPTPQLVGVFLSLAGIVLCIVWAYIAERGKAFHEHWYDQLVALEKEFLSPIKVFENADTYFNREGEITLAGDPRRLRSITRRFKIHSVIKILPFLFLLGWAFLLIVSLVGLLLFLVSLIF